MGIKVGDIKVSPCTIHAQGEAHGYVWIVLLFRNLWLA